MSPLSLLTFDEAVAALGLRMVHGWKLGLDRMEELCRRLDVEAGGSPGYLHVAGTNGKGTTTCFIQNILRTQGKRVGGYYSPYVYSICERIQMQGGLISEAEFATVATKVLAVANQMDDDMFGPATEFECKTAMGFLHWQAQQAEMVALEVGLGGRLDATNVVSPIVCVITSIGLDHQAFLGDTLAEIAGEKAGIIKPGVPVIIGDLPPEAKSVVTQRAQELGCPAWIFGTDILVENQVSSFSVRTPNRFYPGLTAGIVGSKVPHNAALAIAALDITQLIRTPNEIATALQASKMPGRFERVTVNGQEWVFDGSHNQEAAHVLVETWRQQFGTEKATLVTGLLAGHDALPFYEPLAEIVSNVFLVPIDFRRARTPQELANALDGVFQKTQVATTVLAAVAAVGPEPILVTGSFYLLGEVKRALGLI